MSPRPKRETKNSFWSPLLESSNSCQIEIDSSHIDNSPFLFDSFHANLTQGSNGDDCMDHFSFGMSSMDTFADPPLLSRGFTHPIPGNKDSQADAGLYRANTNPSCQKKPCRQLVVPLPDMSNLSNASIQSFQGQILLLSKDQQGCRFLQKKLEEKNPLDVELIFNEVYRYSAELMMDPFGNYLFQKLLDYLSPSQIAIVMEIVYPHLVSISLSMHGTRAVQKLCECVKNSPLEQKVVMSLQNHVIALIKDLNGNHVIQRCLQLYKENQNNQFIYDAILQDCVQVATHRHGCCVIQRCIDHASTNQKHSLVSKLISRALILVQNPFGNYVIQYILDLNVKHFTQRICRQFYGNVCLLSMQKFSSNVIEKCIRVAKEETRSHFVSELLQSDCLERLLGDSYANYVIQTCLECANPGQKLEFISLILPILPSIKNTPHGKRISAKLNHESLLPLVQSLSL